MNKAEAEKIFDIKTRTLCGVVIVELNCGQAKMLLARETLDMMPKADRKKKNAAVMKLFMDESDPDKLAEVVKIFEIDTQTSSLLKTIFTQKHSLPFNPGRAYPERGLAECWCLNDPECKDAVGFWGRLKDLRMVMELLRLYWDGMRCPVLRKHVQASSQEAVKGLVVEVDHCLPGIRRKNYSPMRLTSRSANAMFGHMPWSIKGPILANGDGQMARNMRDYVNMLQHVEKKQSSGAAEGNGESTKSA